MISEIRLIDWLLLCKAALVIIDWLTVFHKKMYLARTYIACTNTSYVPHVDRKTFKMNYSKHTSTNIKLCLHCIHTVNLYTTFGSSFTIVNVLCIALSQL